MIQPMLLDPFRRALLASLDSLSGQVLVGFILLEVSSSLDYVVFQFLFLALESFLYAAGTFSAASSHAYVVLLVLVRVY